MTDCWYKDLYFNHQQGWQRTQKMYVAAVVLENGAVASLSNGILRFSREYMELIRDRANDEGFNFFGPMFWANLVSNLTCKEQWHMVWLFVIGSFDRWWNTAERTELSQGLTFVHVSLEIPMSENLPHRPNSVADRRTTPCIPMVF